MTTKFELLQTIRKHCLNCCSNSYSGVEHCTAGPWAKDSKCVLWAFRLGKDPSEASEAMREKGRKITEVRKMKGELLKAKENVEIRA